MVKIADKHNVSWVIFPLNNDRTAWRPFGLNAILIEPDRRNGIGSPIPNSNVESVRITIENVPQQNLVAGHDHVGVLWPDEELHAITIDKYQLSKRIIDPAACIFYDAAGNEIDYNDAKTGDFFEYTTITGVKDVIEYIKTANYYDLSDDKIDTYDLPSGNYYISYQAQYYNRIITSGINKQLICIDSSKLITALHRFKINHPGELLEETVRLTPKPYLSKFKKSDDRTIEFYRPFIDIMQDMFDEQNLLGNINWVNKIRPEFVPYLIYLLGLNIPFFDSSTDSLRRTMLKNVVRLQQLKGSRRVIIELFELFGYTINIINLYSSQDGSRLIRPGQSYGGNEEITITIADQYEPILSNYDTNGFGQITTPLLYFPVEMETINNLDVINVGGQIELRAYLIDADSDMKDYLDDYTATIDSVNDWPELSGDGLLGQSIITIDVISGKVIDNYTDGLPCISHVNLNYDRRDNVLRFQFDGMIDFAEGIPGLADSTCMYAYVKYVKQQINVPTNLIDLRTNKFDVQINSKINDEVSPNTIEFLLQFLFDIKSFHSILNAIIYSLSFHDTYQATDFCVGGNFETRYDTDAGMQQVPPAIIPNLENAIDCDASGLNVGYKQSDIDYRNKVLADLSNEFITWSKVHDEECLHNVNGQDRSKEDDVNEVSYEDNPNQTANSQSISSQSNLDTSISNGTLDADTSIFQSFYKEREYTKSTYCESDDVSDYCYKGRIRDVTLVNLAVTHQEVVRLKKCSTTLGDGVYYILPQSQLPVKTGYLGRLISAYDTVDGLQYTNVNEIDNRQALIRPSLEIDKTNLNLPGCRFPTINKLKTDYVSSYRAKPWDVDYCVGDYNCQNFPNYLNAKLITNGDGDKVLSFDDVPYTVLGNDLDPDIPTLGENNGAVDNFDIVIHKVYSTAADGHEAVILDDALCLSEVTEGDMIEISDPLFNTAVLDGTHYVDYVDGYSCSRGLVDYDPSDLDRSGLYVDFITEAGLTDDEETGLFNLYTLSSGILYEKGIRLDCDCANEVQCELENESLATDIMLGPIDELNVDSCYLDGVLTDLFSIAV